MSVLGLLFVVVVERLRGRAGQAQRRRRLEAEPLCRRCAERGVVTASTVPDHILPLAKGGSDEDINIRCLCADCHDAVTAEQFERSPVIGVDANGWPEPDRPHRPTWHTRRG